MPAADAPSDHDHKAAEGSDARLGELLVRDGLVTDTQLEAALRLQAASASYVPIGHVLVAHRFISRKTLIVTLRRYGKGARLGEVLPKAGDTTPEHPRGSPPAPPPPL